MLGRCDIFLIVSAYYRPDHSRLYGPWPKPLPGENRSHQHVTPGGFSAVARACRLNGAQALETLARHFSPSPGDGGHRRGLGCGAAPLWEFGLFSKRPKFIGVLESTHPADRARRSILRPRMATGMETRHARRQRHPRPGESLELAGRRHLASAVGIPECSRLGTDRWHSRRTCCCAS